MGALRITITVFLVAFAVTCTVVHIASYSLSITNENSKPPIHPRTVGSSYLDWIPYIARSFSKAAQEEANDLLWHPANQVRPLHPETPSTSSVVSLDAEDAALSCVSQKTGIPKTSFKLRRTLTDSSSTTHVYMILLPSGIPVMNGVVNIVFDRSGKYLGYNSNIVQPMENSQPPSSLPPSTEAKPDRDITDVDIPHPKPIAIDRADFIPDIVLDAPNSYW